MKAEKIKIGVFDSGVGGLSVLKELMEQIPGVEYFYLADQLHVPYGKRSREEIQLFSKKIAEFLFEKGADLIVVACNTASAKALTFLREVFPERNFVGMEPAVKPAAAATQTGKVGVLATRGTFQSDRYASLMERYARDVEVFENPCFGLVELIEEGKLDGEETENLLRKIVEPMLLEKVDTFVLGCTHYPFIEPLLRKITGPDSHLINPAPAVARQTKKMTESFHFHPAGETVLHFFTTGDPTNLDKQVERLIGLKVKSEKFEIADRPD